MSWWTSVLLLTVLANAQDQNHSPDLPQPKGEAQASFLAGTVALNEKHFDDAINSFLKVERQDPDFWRVRLQLVQAYAEAGKTKQRDTERADLRKLRETGKYPELEHMSGYVIDKFEAGNKKVTAVEFFRPSGRNNFYYQFSLLDPEGNLDSTIALESDNFDQMLWAKRHPDLAAKGERMFTLDGYGNSSHTTFKIFDGQPDYETLRTLVVDILNGKTHGLTSSQGGLPPY